MSLCTWLLQPSSTGVRSAFGGEHARHLRAPPDAEPRPAPPQALRSAPSSRWLLPAFQAAEVAGCSSLPTWRLFRCARPLRLSGPDLALTSGFPMCLRADIFAPTDQARGSSLTSGYYSSLLPPQPAQPPACKRSPDWPGCPGQPIEAPFTASAGRGTARSRSMVAKGNAGRPRASAALGARACGPAPA